MTKCDYCDKESVVEWKEWSAILCLDCAIKINRGLKKIMVEEQKKMVQYGKKNKQSLTIVARNTERLTKLIWIFHHI